MGKGRSGIGGSSSSQASINDAVEEYVSGEGMWINDYLRGREGSEYPLSKSEKEYLDNLDRATNNPLESQTLYRSVDAQVIFGDMTDLEFDNLQANIVYGDNQKLIKQDADKILSRNIVGRTFTEKGFMSTTKDLETALDWGGFTGSDMPVVLELKIPKGTKGKDLSNHRMDQGEVLLSRGQKYKINGIRGEQGSIYVTGEIING